MIASSFRLRREYRSLAMLPGSLKMHWGLFLVSLIIRLFIGKNNHHVFCERTFTADLLGALCMSYAKRECDEKNLSKLVGWNENEFMTAGLVKSRMAW